MRRILIATLLALSWTTAVWAQDVRLKDLINIKGVRTNSLLGVGIVVGLSGTGDSNKSLATNKAVANMLTRLGHKTTSAEVTAGNLAAVMVTGELPPFARIGDRIDIKVSAIGDATSIAGGTLILTPLKGADGNVYAAAQGSLNFSKTNSAGNILETTTTLASGAHVEREFLPMLAAAGEIQLSLKKPDFTLASRVSEAVNLHFKGFFARAEDLSSISVTIPPSYQNQVVEFVAELEQLRVNPDSRATVVINEKTGTIVMGQDINLQPVAIAHGDLAIKVGDKSASEKALLNFDGTSVGDLTESLNQLGVKPADLVSILRALHAAGALHADLKFL